MDFSYFIKNPSDTGPKNYYFRTLVDARRFAYEVLEKAKPNSKLSRKRITIWGRTDNKPVGKVYIRGYLIVYNNTEYSYYGKISVLGPDGTLYRDWDGSF